MVEPFRIGSTQVGPGTQKIISLPLSFLADHTRMNMTIQVHHGRKPGPVMFVSGAIHGDEIIGVEIIRRISSLKMLSRLRGTLILVPVVNGYGFNTQSRYLPDRRDLNRSFPGSATGSLAGQLAHIFMTEVVNRCQYGIDLHSGAIHRPNWPQIRANLDDPEIADMASAFGASIMLNANLRDGSLRQAAQEEGCRILLYEASEALRFDEFAARIGVKGIVAVMRHVGMLNRGSKSSAPIPTVRSNSSHWLRAPMGGVVRAQKGLGDSVAKGELIAEVSDPLGQNIERVIARSSGIIIGRSNLPVVNRGDALFHVAIVGDIDTAEDVMETVETGLENDPLFNGFGIV